MLGVGRLPKLPHQPRLRQHQAPPEDAIAANAEDIGHMPYVVSAYNKCHEVLIGYQAKPGDWVTSCGWRFGASKEARPTDIFPVFYKELCEK